MLIIVINVVVGNCVNYVDALVDENKLVRVYFKWIVLNVVINVA